MTALALYPKRPATRHRDISRQVVFNTNRWTDHTVLEAQVLSGLTQHPAIRTTGALIVGPEHFRTPANALVLDWMMAQFREGFDLDALDVIEALSDEPCVYTMPGGGRHYLAGVFATTISAAETLHAAELLGWAR